MYPKELIRYVSGNFSAEDEEFVQNWLKEDPVHQQKLDELRDVWKISGELDLGNENNAWIELQQKTIRKEETDHQKDLNVVHLNTHQKNRSAITIFLKVAAILLVVASAYSLYITNSGYEQIDTNEQLAYQSVSSNEGERVQLRLNDGTKIILNASSKISYLKNYGQSSREIHLEGEAYFEVNNDNPLPFVVFTNGTRVEDISTKFNVKSYPNQQETEVVVSEGKVKVSPKTTSDAQDEDPDNKTTVLLTQGQKVSVNNNTPHQLQVERVDLHEALSWLEDRLIFDAEPLSEIAKRLESYYNVEVLVEDSTLLKKRITTSFNKETLKNVATVLAISMEAEYSLDQNTLRFFKSSHTSTSNE